MFGHLVKITQLTIEFMFKNKEFIRYVDLEVYAANYLSQTIVI